MQAGLCTVPSTRYIVISWLLYKINSNCIFRNTLAYRLPRTGKSHLASTIIVLIFLNPSLQHIHVSASSHGATDNIHERIYDTGIKTTNFIKHGKERGEKGRRYRVQVSHPWICFGPQRTHIQLNPTIPGHFHWSATRNRDEEVWWGSTGGYPGNHPFSTTLIWPQRNRARHLRRCPTDHILTAILDVYFMWNFLPSMMQRISKDKVR